MMLEYEKDKANVENLLMKKHSPDIDGERQLKSV